MYERLIDGGMAAAGACDGVVDHLTARLLARPRPPQRRPARPAPARPATELETDIRKWINEWNKAPKPFVWTKSADEILETLAAYCQRIIDSGH